MKRNLWAVILIGIFFTYTAYALESVIITLDRLKASVVLVKTEVAGMAKGPAQAFKDPKTGRIVVARKMRGAKYNRDGAGAILDTYGTIVTNAHVVENAGRITVTLSDGSLVQAELIKSIPQEDIAFIKIQPPYALPPVDFFDSNTFKLRDRVFNIGSSEAIKGAFTEGKVTGIGQTAKNRKTGSDMIDLIQTSFNVYKGDSGGPLFTEDGKFAGLIVAAHTAVEHTTYSIPAEKIRLNYQQLIKGSHTSPH